MTRIHALGREPNATAVATCILINMFMIKHDKQKSGQIRVGFTRLESN